MRFLFPQLHPDKNPGVNEADRVANHERFIRVAQAYEVLRSHRRRKEYDYQLRLMREHIRASSNKSHNSSEHNDDDSKCVFFIVFVGFPDFSNFNGILNLQYELFSLLFSSLFSELFSGGNSFVVKTGHNSEDKKTTAPI